MTTETSLPDPIGSYLSELPDEKGRYEYELAQVQQAILQLGTVKIDRDKKCIDEKARCIEYRKLKASECFLRHFWFGITHSRLNLKSVFLTETRANPVCREHDAKDKVDGIFNYELCATEPFKPIGEKYGLRLFASDHIADKSPAVYVRCFDLKARWKWTEIGSILDGTNKGEFLLTNRANRGGSNPTPLWTCRMSVSKIKEKLEDNKEVSKWLREFRLGTGTVLSNVELSEIPKPFSRNWSFIIKDDLIWLRIDQASEGLIEKIDH